jgi:hypothetical protein
LLFKQALEVMGDLYASAIGTTVLQLREIPPRPPEYAVPYALAPDHIGEALAPDHTAEAAHSRGLITSHHASE